MIWSNRLFTWSARCFTRALLPYTPQPVSQSSDNIGLVNAYKHVFLRCNSSDTARRPWTQQEIDTALARREAGDSIQSVATLLGRTDHSVRTKLNHVRSTQPPSNEGKYAPWTEQDAADALAQYKAGASYKSIAVSLGFPAELVKSRIRRLRKRTGTASRQPRWTQQEKDSAVLKFRAGQPAESIASSAGRTAVAIERKIYVMRKLDPKIPMSPYRFTAAEDQQISEMRARGVPISEIAKSLPRPRAYSSVERRLKNMSTKASLDERGKHGQPWTEDEKAKLHRVLVEENLPWPKICALMPGRSMSSLKAIAGKLGFRRRREPQLPWSAGEIDLIRRRMALGRSGPPSRLEVQENFPGRSYFAVRCRWYDDVNAQQVGIVQRPGPAPWSTEDDQVVFEGLEKNSSPSSIAALLPNRSRGAVTRRVHMLRHKERSRKERE